MDRNLHIVIDEAAAPNGADVVRLEPLPANDVSPWRRVGLMSGLAGEYMPLITVEQARRLLATDVDEAA
jgi:hypothetical protein